MWCENMADEIALLTPQEGRVLAAISEQFHTGTDPD
jgi:hypothetical protein